MTLLGIAGKPLGVRPHSKRSGVVPPVQNTTGTKFFVAALKNPEPQQLHYQRGVGKVLDALHDVGGNNHNKKPFTGKAAQLGLM